MQEGSAPTTAYGRLAARILAQIRAGELKPGDRLPRESELSSSYDVSRNTAREALRVLASQGLVVSKRGVGGGTFVSHPSAGHITDALTTGLGLLSSADTIAVSALLEVREMIELQAAELAALRRTGEELELMRTSLFDPSDVDPSTVFHHNRSFHNLVLRATHNPLLEVVVEPVFRILEQRFSRELADASFWTRVDEDHRGILELIELRDQAGAREATRAHLRFLRATYEAIDHSRQGLDTAGPN